MKEPKSESRGIRNPIFLLIAWGLAFQAVAVLLFATFQADDYPAIAYASDWSHVAHDFVGSQYDLHFFLFYRPLITLSLAVDHLLFGVNPVGFLAMNCLAAILSGLLLHGLLKRLVPDRSHAWVVLALPMIWLAHPVLRLSTSWVVGRVDTHVVFWILLALWLHLARRRGGAAWPVWLALVCAFMTKEYALGAPLLLLGLDLLDPVLVEDKGRRYAGRRLLALPTLLLIPAFLLWRRLVLGAALGGYGFLEGQSLEPLGILEGIWSTLGSSVLPVGPIWFRSILVVMTIALVLLWILRGSEGRTARLVGVLLISAGLFGPLAPLLLSMRDPGQQRYAYLAVLWPWTILGLASLGPGPRARLAQVALMAAGLLLIYTGNSRAMRALWNNDDFVRSVVATLEDADGAMRDPRSPLLLAGDAELAFRPERFLWGLGSVLKPPFRPSGREVLSLRRLHPLAQKVDSAWFGPQLRGLVPIDAKGAVPHPEQHWGPASPPGLVAPLGFDGRLEPATVGELERGARYGWPAGDGYGGQLAVCTGFGSFLQPISAKGGRILLADLLLANVSFGTSGATNLALDLLWNGFDLAKQSPISLYWKNAEGLQRAELRVSPDFPAWYWGLHR